MVKITSEKTASICVKRDNDLRGIASSTYCEGDKDIAFYLTNLQSGQTSLVAFDKAELTELIEMLQQFAEYLEE